MGALCVGDSQDLPLGSLDPAILHWAEREERIIVSRDEKTMKTHLADHLHAGHHSPGLSLIRKGSSLVEVVFFLVAAAHASEPFEWQDQDRYIS